MQEWKAVASAEDAFWTPPPPPPRLCSVRLCVQLTLATEDRRETHRGSNQAAERRVHWRARCPCWPLLRHERGLVEFGGRHTEYSEKVGKRGSMPKLIAQRPAIGSWTWSRDCVYWCRLAGPKGLADGHPPTTYCYVVVDGLALAKQKKMMVIEDTDPLLPPSTPRHVEPQLVSLGNFAENFCPHLCLPANSLFSPCSHGDINWREIRLFFFLALCLSECTDRHKDNMRAYAANSEKNYVIKIKIPRSWK